MRARAVRTRGELVSAAELAFSLRGDAATSAHRISERAVAIASIYQYFPDEDALLRELASLRQGALSPQLFDAASQPASDLESLLRRILQVVVDFQRENPALHAVISERQHADPELAAIISAGEKVLLGARFDLLEHQDSDSQTDLAATSLCTVWFGRGRRARACIGWCDDIGYPDPGAFGGRDHVRCAADRPFLAAGAARVRAKAKASACFHQVI
jgi:AcrR family transcriptional regulator